MPHVGKCLCGACTVTINANMESQVFCHCIDCRKTSGSAFTTNVIPLRSDVKIEGPTGSYTAPSDSGHGVERVFCVKCGCALSHFGPWFGEKQAIQSGIFEDFANVPVGAEIYIKDKWPILPTIEGAAQVDANP